MFRIILMALSFIGIVNAGNLENGTYTESFDNGNPKYEISYQNSKKHGKEIFWFESGNKKMESHFESGVENGPCRQWHKNGKLKLEVLYENCK